MSGRVSFVVLVTIACRDDAAASRSPLETAIARALTARFAIPVAVACDMAVPHCEATFFDGTKLPIEVHGERKEVAWRISGMVVDTSRIVTRVNAELTDLHVAQRASCGTRIQLVKPGDRIGCKLSGGGLAFARVAADGTISLEVALDAASAAARGEAVTPARDAELAKMSRGLEALEGESDGEEALPSDGGVP